MKNGSNINLLDTYTKSKNLVFQYFDDDNSGAVSKSLIPVIVRVGALLCLYLALHWWFGHAADMPESSYYKTFIFFEIVKNLGLKEILFLFLVLFTLASYNRKIIWKSWSDFADSDRLRIFITFVAALLAWSYSTYGFNFYFKEEHYLDRIFLVLLAITIYWKPGFVFPFLALLGAVIHQFDFPFGTGFARPMDNLLTGTLTIFAASYILNGLTGNRNNRDFLFLVCCLLAAHYWWPGFGKLKLNWITHGHLYLLPMASYAHGWLAFLDPMDIVNFAELQIWLDWPMIMVTLALEWGALFALWRRSLFKWMILGWILFHVGVFINTGYFFWKWVALEAALLILFFKNSLPAVHIFDRRYFAVSLVLIGGVIFWFRPAALAWYDTPLSYTYRIEAVGESGKIYELPPEFFQPYSDIFAFCNFGYLLETPQLVGPYGATGSRQTAASLLKVKTADQVFKMEAEKRPRRLSAKRLENFDNFFKQYIRNFNHRLGWRFMFNSLQSPPVFMTFPKKQAFHGEEPIKTVIVNQVTTLFDGSRLKVVRDIIARQIQIPKLEKGYRWKQ